VLNVVARVAARYKKWRYEWQLIGVNGAVANSDVDEVGRIFRTGMDMRRAVLCERFASDLSAFSSDAIQEESAQIWSNSRPVYTTISSRPEL
jgi:hypothetical protein